MQLVARHSLPYAVILQTREEDGFCKLIVKRFQEGIPVIQATLEVGQQCNITTSFDKDLFDVLTGFYPHPNFQYVTLHANLL